MNDTRRGRVRHPTTLTAVNVRRRKSVVTVFLVVHEDPARQCVRVRALIDYVMSSTATRSYLVTAQRISRVGVTLPIEVLSVVSLYGVP